MKGNTITIHLARGRIAETGNLFQYDAGQVLLFEGVELPPAFQVHFANDALGKSKPMVATPAGVQIPDEYLLSGNDIHLWVYVTEENYALTEYHGIIHVTRRAEPTDIEPTPVEQSVIDTLVEELNTALETAQDLVDGIPGAIDDALTAAKESGEFDGKDGDPGADGFSPSATVSKSGNTATITITDKSGTTTAQITDGLPGTPGEDGDPGADGFSPSATVSKSGKVTTLTVTDKTGTTTAEILDGEDGSGADIIDDTAGEGDTDKVWSADKTARGLSTLNFALEQKLDSPSTAGTSGQVLTSDGQGGQSWQTPQSGGGAVDDVQIDGTSIVSQGVANIPYATGTSAGVIKAGGALQKVTGYPEVFYIKSGSVSGCKNGINDTFPLTPSVQSAAVYYGLAQAAGADMRYVSGETVGVYPVTQKSAIHDMLNAPESVSGTTPSITGKAGIRYVCGECATLTIVVPASGIIDVVFDSGSTPTVLTVTPPTGMTMRWIGEDPTALEANKHYEINIMDGCNGMVVAWT